MFFNLYIYWLQRRGTEIYSATSILHFVFIFVSHSTVRAVRVFLFCFWNALGTDICVCFEAVFRWHWFMSFLIYINIQYRFCLRKRVRTHLHGAVHSDVFSALYDALAA